jgi:SAM-dependent methyltransferase
MAPPIHSIDHFSEQAAAYHAYRPVYPPALSAFLASRGPARRLAWDCGCGSGQFTTSLSFVFERVVGTDMSLSQLRQAQRSPKIDYLEALAEAAPFTGCSVDLVVAAQAMHWFNLDAFYAEVRRVVRPGGIIAAVSYGLLEVSPAIDRLIKRLHTDIVGPFWPPERRHVDTGYAELPFPFPQIEPPKLAMKEHWTLSRLLGYLGTWSAVQKYIHEKGIDPLNQIREELTHAWGDPTHKRIVRWPLAIKIGKVE